MSLSEEIKYESKELSFERVIRKFESLDYSDRRNYESLCAEYRKAVYEKNNELADALYARMRLVQRMRSSNIVVLQKALNRGIKRKVAELKKPTRKELIISEISKKYSRELSTANVFYYCYKKRARISSEEVAKHFNSRPLDAANLLDYGAAIQVFTKFSDGKYKVKKIKKILEHKLIRYINATNNTVHELYRNEIDKNGEILIHPASNAPQKKKKRSISYALSDDKTGKYDRSGDMPFLASEYSSSDIDSMRETGHGRKKSNEYTKNMAIENSRSRYGLKDEKPILEYDLD